MTHAADKDIYNEEVCGIRNELVYQNQIYVAAGEILSYLSGKSFEEAVINILVTKYNLQNRWRLDIINQSHHNCVYFNRRKIF